MFVTNVTYSSIFGQRADHNSFIMSLTSGTCCVVKGTLTCFCQYSFPNLPFFYSAGLELLLGDVYDTAFSSLDVGRSFSQSNMYRILQRRYLAVQLALTGQFRCEFKYMSVY